MIVVADDLSSESEDKERILRHQHSIKTYAEDLFLFTEYKKYTDSLKTIKEMIRKREFSHKIIHTVYIQCPPSYYQNISPPLLYDNGNNRDEYSIFSRSDYDAKFKILHS